MEECYSLKDFKDSVIQYNMVIANTHLEWIDAYREVFFISHDLINCRKLDGYN